MRKSLKCLCLVSMVAFLLTGCAVMSTGMMPAPMLYAEYKVPSCRLQAPEGETPSTALKGEAKAINVLGIVAVGDASVTAAMNNGRITKIHHVDCQVKSILGIFAELTVIVYGE